MTNTHYVIFDGTSAFVGDYSDIDSDCEILYKSLDIEKCQDFCDEFNNNNI